MASPLRIWTKTVNPLHKIKYVSAIFWRFRYYILSAAATLVFWDSVLIKPFRVFVVLIHEFCHALASLATGGQVLEIRARLDESGYTFSQGGFFPLISAAGYVGSAAIGALLIWASRLPQAQRFLVLILGGGSVAMIALYTPLGGLDFYLGLVIGVALVWIALKSGRWSAAVGTWMGIMLCLYSLHDFRTDLWMYPEKTDAGLLARYWGLPALATPIALSWVLVSLSLMYRAMRHLVRHGGK